MMLAVKNELIAATSDSRLTVQEHIKENEVVGDKRGAGTTETPKIYQLNERILLGIGGIVHTGSVLLPQIQEVVSEDDYLEDITDKIEKILISNYENRLEHSRTNAVTDPDRTSLSFMGTKYFGLYFTGFLRNGNTALACWNPETRKLEITESTNHPVIVIFSSNEQDIKEFSEWFYFGTDYKPEISDYIQQLLLVHSVISYKEAETISSDCTVIYVDNELNNGSLKQDTSILYEVLDQADDLEYETVARLLTE